LAHFLPIFIAGGSQQWKSLALDAQALWDKLDDESKAIILGHSATGDNEAMPMTNSCLP